MTRWWSSLLRRGLVTCRVVTCCADGWHVLLSSWPEKVDLVVLSAIFWYGG